MQRKAEMLAYAAGVILACTLTGCTFWPDGEVSKQTTSAPEVTGVSCSSDLFVESTSQMNHKGLSVDDTSFFECPDQLVRTWPHTKESVRYLRLFKAYRPEDDEETATNAREQFANFVKFNNIKVLVGSQITCNETEDNDDWEHVKLLLKALGSDHVLALAVGNELDQWPNIGIEKECIDKVWDGYLLEKTQSRIKWAREALGNPALPVTSVFTGAIVWAGDESSFDDGGFSKANSYFKAMLDSGEKNYVFTFNFYPIFDPSNVPDADGTCNTAMHMSSCYDEANCLSQQNLVATRQKLDKFVQSQPSWNMQSARFWVGELGWSSPKPATVPDSAPMAACDAFFSKNMLHQYYNNFLQWDLSIYSETVAPEYVFYFTMRDAKNYGNQEHFGLMESCQSKTCKVSAADVQASLSMV